MNYLDHNTIKKINTYQLTSEDLIVSNYNKCATSSDMQTLIEHISLTSDTKLLMKLYSVLASNLITHPHLRESVVKCYVLYEKVNYLLSLGQPSKTIAALNFLITLAYNDDDEDLSIKQSAAQYARNMIRVSGCLKIILQYFTSHNMMHADTWKVVCQCIVECCRGSDINQAHCSHLIPVCIAKCKKGDILTLSVLHALLQDNKRNCEYFVDSSGLDIFTRALLCESACVQLLAALVQEAPRASKLLQLSSVPQQLIALVQKQGKFTKIGQWCKIILYYIYGDLKVLDEVKEVPNNMSYVENMKIIDEKEFTPESKFFERDNLNSTSTLLNNLMQEIFIFNKENNSTINKQATRQMLNDFGYIKSAPSNYFVSGRAQEIPKQNVLVEDGFQENANCCSNLINTSKIKRTDSSNSSFINKNSIQGHRQETTDLNMLNRNNNGDVIHATCRSNGVRQGAFEKSAIHFTFNSKGEYHREFNPKTTSTPKWKTLNRSNRLSTKTSYNTNKTAPNRKNIDEHSYMHKHDTALRRRTGARRPRRRHRRDSVARSAQGRSVSARIFGALNETCSTVVNAIKGMIMPQRKPNASIVEKATDDQNLSGNFSFTRYMKRRDAVLRCIETEENDHSFDNIEVKDRTSISSSTENADGSACETCNDTILLKKKLANDDYLKETLRKLKIGINMYGCDFKKLSKVMWRDETFMTPRVLYNLYRKLILK